jgi:hypothetical protein
MATIREADVRAGRAVSNQARLRVEVNRPKYPATALPSPDWL